jgi:histone H3/H4
MQDSASEPISASRKLSAAAQHRRYQRNIRKDIEAMQRSTRCFIPYTSFSRVVHEILADEGEYCIRSDAVHALQTAAEDHLTTMFSDANKLARYSGRETVSGDDLRFIVPPDVWPTAEADAIPEETALPLPAQVL